MQQVSPEKIEYYNRLLNELSKNEKVSTDLPKLAPEKWLISEYLNNIKQWIENLFNFDPIFPKPLETSWDLSFLRWLPWVMLATVALLILTVLSYFLWRYFKGRSGAKPHTEKHLGQLRNIIPAQQNVASPIESALQSNDIAKASRLRWKLFLSNQQAKAFITPLEWQRTHLNELGEKNSQWTLEANELMFGKSSQQLQNYQSFDQHLTQMGRSISNASL